MNIFVKFALFFVVLFSSSILCADRCCSSVETCIHTCDAYSSNGNCLPGPTRPGVSTVPICNYMNDTCCTDELNGICSQSNYKEVCQERYGTSTNTSGSSSGSSSADDCCPNPTTCRFSCQQYRNHNNTFPGPIGRPGVSTIPICKYMNNTYCSTKLGHLCSLPNYEQLCEEKY